MCKRDGDERDVLLVIYGSCLGILRYGEQRKVEREERKKNVTKFVILKDQPLIFEN